MPSIRLTKDEIKEITGATKRQLQAEILLRLDIPFKVRPDGNILISRLAYERAMGGITDQAFAAMPEPNFDSLKNDT